MKQRRNSVWIRNQLDVTFVLSFISPLQVAQHVSGNHVPIFKSWVVLWTPQWTHYLLTGSDSLPAATAQYQHVAITLHSCQLLKMGTWLPETCRATCKGEISKTQKWHLDGFLSILNYDAWSTTHHINEEIVNFKTEKLHHLSVYGTWHKRVCL